MNWYFYYNKFVVAFRTMTDAISYAKTHNLHGLIINNNLISKEV